MKVLYVGVYRDGTGWGRAAIDYILALDAAGVDVVPRALKLNNSVVKLPERLLELEAKSSSGCDVCIQHVLPHQMRYDGKFKKNIGLFVCETSNFKSSSWPDFLNTMDEIIVPCRTNWRACRMSGVTNVPIHVVPHATDITRFQRRYEPYHQVKTLKDQGNFVFYTIGEWVKRKNYRELLKAFYTEFDPDEPVELVVKTSVPGLSPANAMKVIGGEAYQIRLDLKLHGGQPEAYKNVKFILDRLTDEQLMGLHIASDCFVQASFGEAWSIPAFDAMAMGKMPIVPSSSGYLDYMVDDPGRETGWLVDTHETQVCGITDSFSDLYTGRESWDEVRGRHLQSCMREAYEDAHERFNRANAGRERAYDFSYERVGQMLQKVLNGEETA